MTSFVNLARASYIKPSVSPDRLNFLSAKYKNIKFHLQPTNLYVVKISDQSNAPGIAFSVYGDRDYWWVICMYNGILDPISEFKPGTTLKLPSLTDINAYLTADTTTIGSTITI